METNTITFSGSNEKLFSRTMLSSVHAKLTLIVPETHNAILIKDGQMLQTLNSGKYKVLDFVELEKEEKPNLEVLFMSKTAKLKLLWGTTSKFLMYDNVIQENYYLGMGGDFEVQIGDPRKCYLYLVGVAEDLTADGLQERLMSNVVSVAENATVDFVKEHNISFNQVGTNKKTISQKVLSSLSHALMNEYGIKVFSFNISNIIIEEKDLERLSKIFKSTKSDEEKSAPVEVVEASVKEEKEISMTCKTCGAKLDAGAKFCMQCGTKVTAMATKPCPSCNFENSLDAKFCIECGHKF